MSENTNRVEVELVDVMSGYTAEQAREYMERAEKAAEEAENTYNNLLESLEQATTEAVEKAVETATGLAKEYAEQAEEAAAVAAAAAADEAEKAVDEIVNAAAEKLEQELKIYTSVGAVDLNEQYEYARIYVDAGSANAPTDTEKFFVDVDIETDGEKIRQIATGAATGAKWVRNGEPNPDYEEPTEDELETESEGAVIWDEWTQGLYGFSFSADGAVTTPSGLKLTADGHIILPTGVEFY